jgi:hypothetical protein
MSLYPFMPMSGRKPWKHTTKREDSEPTIEVSSHPIEFESPVAEAHRNKTSPRPTITC